ncbi:MAG: hypothetical protein R3Y61_05850 [Rikenellaceae bacterium]
MKTKLYPTFLLVALMATPSLFASSADVILVSMGYEQLPNNGEKNAKSDTIRSNDDLSAKFWNDVTIGFDDEDNKSKESFEIKGSPSSELEAMLKEEETEEDYSEEAEMEEAAALDYKELFGELFNIDTESQEDVMITPDWTTGQRVEIPSWVFMSANSGRYLGVSDPCLTESAGTKQALLRAWFLSLMDKEAKIEIVIEDFQTIKQVGTWDAQTYDFNQFVRIAPAARTVALKITNIWTSLFGETFVEVTEVPLGESGDYMEEYDVLFTAADAAQLVAEYMVKGSDNLSSKNYVRSELLIYAVTDTEDVANYYVRYGSRMKYQLIRSLNTKEITNKERGRFWYNDSYNASKDAGKAPNVSLNDGVWCSIYELLAERIVNFENYPYKMKSVDEHSNDRTYTLVRSIFSGNASISMQSLSITENTIKPTWRISLL